MNLSSVTTAICHRTFGDDLVAEIRVSPIALTVSTITSGNRDLFVSIIRALSVRAISKDEQDNVVSEIVGRINNEVD